MAILAFTPVSADSFEPVEFSTNALNALFSMSDINLHYSTINNYVNFAYTFNSSRVYTDVKNTNPSANYDKTYFTFSQNSFYTSMPFVAVCTDTYNSTATPTAGRYINYRYIINFPINLYIYDTTLTFYFISHTSTISISCSYLDSDDQPHNVSSTYSLLNSGNIYSYINSGNLSSGFVNNFTANIYNKSFTKARAVDSDFNVVTTGTKNNMSPSGYLYSVSINFDRSAYYDVSTLNFNFVMNNDDVENYFMPYVSFYTASPLTFYEYRSSSGGSVDLSYIEDMLDTIGGQLDDVNDKLDVVIGEPSSENQGKLDELQELETTIDDIDDMIDSIHQAEQMPTLPFTDSSATLPVPQNGETDSYNGFFYTFFTQFPLIQQIILSGGVCLIFYVLLRRI